MSAGLLDYSRTINKLYRNHNLRLLRYNPDVWLSKTCATDGCRKQPRYGIPGNSPTRCAEHKEDGMIAYPRKKCIKKGCNEIALFGLSHAIHCEEHKDENEMNLIEHKCKNCPYTDILNENGYCRYCEPSKYHRAVLAKQREVKLYFDQHDIKYVLYDARIEENQCGLERPDFVFESKAGSHMIVVEIDEFQHKSRAEICECTRMINISQEYGLPTIYIRYNPDEYKTDRRKHSPSFKKRMDELCGWVRYLQELCIDELKEYGYCSYVRLFYDDYKKGNVNVMTIMKFDKM